MKKVIIIILMLMSANVTFAQTKSGSYLTKLQLELQECSSNGTPIAGSMQTIPQNAIFTIVGIDKDEKYYIRFWKWTLSEDEMNDLKIYRESVTLRTNKPEDDEHFKPILEKVRKFETLNQDVNNNLTRYFLIDEGFITNYCTKKINKIVPTSGATALPFKWRPKTKEVIPNFSFAGLVGARWNVKAKSTLTFSALIGLGLSTVALDSNNAKGLNISGSDRSAITIPVGVVTNWRGIQFGVFSGLDFISNNKIDKWMNQGKPWFSIGLGISVFTADANFPKETSND